MSPVHAACAYEAACMDFRRSILLSRWRHDEDADMNEGMEMVVVGA